MINLTQIALSKLFTIRLFALILFSSIASGCILPASSTSSNQANPDVTTDSELTERNIVTTSPTPPIDQAIVIESTATPTITTKNSNEPVTIVGNAKITFPLFENYLVEPYVMLEDEAGFVNRDFDFIIPPQDQVLGPLTPRGENTWDYVLHLPSLPPGILVDVDNNSQNDTGVRIFAVAVQANTIGDPFLGSDEFRGWSTVWTSARIDSENRDEIVGGKLIVWSPDNKQSFPSDFGSDKLLFTNDDPTKNIEAGYTIVNLDSNPFTFTKERISEIILYEGDVEINDLSDLSYTEAFNALWSKASIEYPFTQLKSVDWQNIYDRFAPQVTKAEASSDPQAWYLAMRNFAWSIPDGHIGLGGDDGGLFQKEAGGGAGLGMTELSDGRVLVNYVDTSGTAAKAGIKLGDEIISYNNIPIRQAIQSITPLNGPFSTDHVLKLEQYRYISRGKVGDSADIEWKDSTGIVNQATIILRSERNSLAATSLYADFDRNAPPIEYEIIDDYDIGYIRIWSLSDDLNLTFRLFRRAVQLFNDNDTTGVIIDLRHNLGGSPMGTSLASFFTQTEIEVMRGYYYSDKLKLFDTYGPPDSIEPDKNLFYEGRVAILVGPACASACENVAWVFSQLPQVTVLGHYPSNGIMGEVGRGQYKLPGDLSFQIPTGMDQDMENNIIVEGTGVVPDILIPITEANIFENRDIVLEEAIDLLSKPLVAGIIPSGSPRLLAPSLTLTAAKGNTPILEELANETPNYEMPEPGQKRVYSIPMDNSTESIWWYSWCATNKNIAYKNWSNITVNFYLNDELVSKNELYKTDGQANQEYCFYELVGLTDWPRGEHVLHTKVSFDQEINDGSTVYPIGLREFEYHVYVN